MRKKTIIAVLTACMMLVTLAPAASWAASYKKPIPQKDISGIQQDYEEASRQYLLDMLDQSYMDSIKDKSDYDSGVWKEIQEVYKEGREVYSRITLEEYWSDEISDYGGILGQLGQIKKGSKLAAVKKSYLKEIDTELRYYKQSDYTDYYWDLIQDCLYIGKKQLNSAKTFREAAEGYLYAMMGMEAACDKEELDEIREEMIAEINQYVNLALDPSGYTAAEWKAVKEIQARAIRELKAAELEEEMDEIYERAGKDFFAVTGVAFPVEGSTFIDELLDKLETFYEKMDESLYSEEMLEQLDDIYWDAEEALYYAQTRDQAQKIYDTAISKMKAVPTKKEEIAAIQKIVPKIKSVKSKDSASVKVSWKKVKGATGYTVYRSASAKGKYKEIKDIKGTSMTDTGLKLGKTYYYKVRAYKTIDRKNYYSKYSASAKGMPMLAKAVVTLSKSAGGAVSVKWKKIKGARGFEIYRATSYNGKYSRVKVIKDGSAISWKDTSVKKGQKYYYKVRGYCKLGGKTKYSPYSSVKSIKR
ncbi:hypothetical protein LI177_08185 [bacterium 210820-DFI.6.37]|nr:hypothetical protein [bacterium 210820-DFI.6.37]